MKLAISVLMLIVVCYGCDQSSTTTSPYLNQAVTVPTTFTNSFEETVFFTQGTFKGEPLKLGTFPGQTNRLQFTIPAGAESVEIPAENKAGKILGTLVVSRKGISYKPAR
jgi:hypothetical protein